ncbi:MAG: HTH domain-containing protein [Fluviicoccus sp.]|uniref:COG2958 family protein n=1 Tax=Fluviicoccus sp. TaxID=2003552 RepID=UPI002716EFCA|nr:HTH domain-containing protein [Fluviicoccus sp.]MDO8329237.1 HTH domain-containing protein [Fluviicoccus sp.]
MEKLGFLELAKKLLAEQKRPLSSEEIWELAKQTGYDKQVGSRGKTPVRTLGARLYIDMRDNVASPFCKVGSRPVRFFLKSLPIPFDLPLLQEAAGESKPGTKRPVARGNFLEKDLYPLLSYFASLHLRVYSRTIRLSQTDNKDYGEWFHPDMVGCYFPMEEWQTDVYELNSTLGNTAVRFYSFEVKRELNFANLRETFFQAVSNSSWANEGYLVAARISDDEEFIAELSRLSATFGIGIIELNTNEPDASSIIFPAARTETLDWDVLNKMATINQDFHDFIKRVKTDIQSREIRKEWYERIFSSEELQDLFR